MNALSLCRFSVTLSWFSHLTEIVDISPVLNRWLSTLLLLKQGPLEFPPWKRLATAFKSSLTIYTNCLLPPNVGIYFYIHYENWSTYLSLLFFKEHSPVFPWILYFPCVKPLATEPCWGTATERALTSFPPMFCVGFYVSVRKYHLHIIFVSLLSPAGSRI